MRRHAVLLGLLLPAAVWVSGALGASDARSVELAESVMERMGGSDAWAATRFVKWKFFGRRVHYWDRHTGGIRIEAPAREKDGVVERPEMLILMNIRSKAGRAWSGGEELAADALKEALQAGHEWWVNDSYWMFMPYKLLDPGVTLAYKGARKMEDGREADVVDMTFGDGVGYTPKNRYEVFVARDTGLIEQWSFFAEASEEEPRFTMPWSDWEPFGKIRLATDHGRGIDWEIAVYDELPKSVFENAESVAN